VKQQRRAERPIEVDAHSVTVNLLIASRRDRYRHAVRPGNLIGELRGIVPGQLRRAADVVIDLDRRNRLIAVVLDVRPVVVEALVAIGRRDERLNLQRDRVEHLDRNPVVGKRIANDLSVDHARGARIVNRVFHDRPAEGIGAEDAAGERAAEVATAIRHRRQRRAHAW
jgi:hypothetical protein